MPKNYEVLSPKFIMADYKKFQQLLNNQPDLFVEENLPPVSSGDEKLSPSYHDRRRMSVVWDNSSPYCSNAVGSSQEESSSAFSSSGEEKQNEPIHPSQLVGGAEGGQSPVVRRSQTPRLSRPRGVRLSSSDQLLLDLSDFLLDPDISDLSSCLSLVQIDSKKEKVCK